MPGPGAFVIGKEEREEIEEVLATGYFSRYGDPQDDRFRRKVYNLETEFARYSGVKHCVATSSGTASIYIALKALGIGPGDEVIVPAYTFVASYSAIIFAGAVPVLAEIDDSLNLDPEDVEQRITGKTRAIMPVHMLGNPCGMEELRNIADSHGLPMVEDCCQAAGASYRGKKIGSIGEFGTFSLNFFKTITAGDGGLVITDDDELYWKAFALHDQGHSPNRTGVEIGKRSILGFNFRINELTGAVALAQLRKIDTIVSTLRKKKSMLKQRLSGLEGFSFRRLNDVAGECGTLLTLIFLHREKAEKVAAALGSKTLAESGWHVYYNMEHILRCLNEIGRGYQKGSMPKTDDLLARSLNISVGVVDPGIGSAFGINIRSSEEEIERIASKIAEAVS
jgi:dTDP-4-amino-4,6-dideoxygalactose transaminase